MACSNPDKKYAKFFIIIIRECIYGNRVMNKVYADYFKTAAPARSAVQVARLPKDGLIEIEAIALVLNE
ncbi:MAG: hypothetical protein GXO75_03610 [Calditrichaeota bacterium]|nr:hypothetical protein [Calditrichota bacterium]